MKALTVKKATSAIEVAFQIPDWFKELNKEGQDKYLKEHPHSKLAKSFHAKKDAMNKPTDSAKSPTNFKGPDSKKTAMGDDPRKERNIVSMMDKLAKMAADAKVKGEAAPNYDLCKVSIPGTNLFCKVNKGIPRDNMPQLKGIPIKDSWADKNLEKDKKGEVSGEDAFKAYLKQADVKLANKKVDVATLKATQTDLVGAKVAGMLQALKKDPTNPGITAPIFVSKDNFIIDGHHRWAALVGLNMADGRPEPIEMNVIQIDLPIEEVIKRTKEFCDSIGIESKAAKTVKESASNNLYKGCCS